MGKGKGKGLGGHISIRLYNFNGMGNQNTQKGKMKIGGKLGKTLKWAGRENNDTKIRGLCFMSYSR